jgi:ferrochelatase
MIPDVIFQHPYLFLALTAFLVNVWFGYIRQGHPRFSAKWFFWIHASIPFLIYFRIKLQVSAFFIPVSIFLAVLGQIAGGRCRRKRMTREDNEKLEQIPDLKFPRAKDDLLDEKEVMVALLNMGGPRTNSDVKPFLRRIFMDPLIIRFPFSSVLQSFFAWLLVTLRGQTTAERYQLIGGSSPILRATARQTLALKRELKKRGHNVSAVVSFNYSWPLPEDTIRKAKKEGKKYILPLSLYPHYSAATTGSNMHYLKKTARDIYPEVTFLKPPEYFLADGYIGAFVDRIQEALGPGESLDDFYLLFSAHGLPVYFLTEGDPYPFQVAQTTAKVLERLKRAERWTVSYQSDVGPLQWLKPSTEKMIETLADAGIKKLLVVPISFVTDHIETLCEIDIEYRKTAEDAGIADFRMSRAIESHPGFIRALADCVERYLKPARVARTSSLNPAGKD